MLFALVANRALDPSLQARRGALGLPQADIPDGLAGTTDDACYRAMDWLHEVRDALERQVFGQVAAALLPLEVDLLFFDYPANKARDLALAA